MTVLEISNQEHEDDMKQMIQNRQNHEASHRHKNSLKINKMSPSKETFNLPGSMVEESKEESMTER